MSAPSIRLEDIEDLIVDEQYFTATQGVYGAAGAPGIVAGVPLSSPLDRITICVLTLKNGFTAVGVNEGPVSAENFDAALGREYARKQALEKLWLVLGYQLKEALYQRRSEVSLQDAQAYVKSQLQDQQGVLATPAVGPKQYAPKDVWRVQVITEASRGVCEVVLKMQDGTSHKVQLQLEKVQDLRGRSELDLHEYALQQANRQLQELYRTVRRVSPT